MVKDFKKNLNINLRNKFETYSPLFQAIRINEKKPPSKLHGENTIIQKEKNLKSYDLTSPVR